MDWNEFLREAVAEKDMDLVRQALAMGADPNHRDPDEVGAFIGTTPLYWAVSRGNVEIARLLLEAGARVAAEDQASSSSLHAAVEDKNLPMVDLLLEYDGCVALDWFDEIERTPLICALEAGYVEIARRLLDAGTDVNAHNEARIGDTALHRATANGTWEMVELLLKAGADPTIPGGMGITPLHKGRERKRGDGPRISAALEKAAKRFSK